MRTVGLREWVIPSEDKFFDLLERESKNVVIAAEQLLDLFNPNDRLEASLRRIIGAWVLKVPAAGGLAALTYVLLALAASDEA